MVADQQYLKSTLYRLLLSTDYYLKKDIIVNEEEFKKFLENIKEEARYGQHEEEKFSTYYVEASLINTLDEEQKLELLLFSKKYPIRVNSKQTLGLFSLQIFLAELSDKYALLLK